MFSISESTPYGRRDFLKIGGLTLGGLTQPAGLPALASVTADVT